MHYFDADFVDEITWKEFFEQFEKAEPALIYEENTNFNKLVGRGTASPGKRGTRMPLGKAEPGSRAAAEARGMVRDMASTHGAGTHLWDAAQRLLDAGLDLATTRAVLRDMDAGALDRRELERRVTSFLAGARRPRQETSVLAVAVLGLIGVVGWFALNRATQVQTAAILEASSSDMTRSETSRAP